MKENTQGFMAVLKDSSSAFWSSLKNSVFNRVVASARSKADLKLGTIQIPGQNLAYLERTGPGETMLLLHGIGGSKDFWSQFVRNTPRDYRVIALDLPGHGDNIKDQSQTYSIDYMTTSLAQAINALKLERFHIAGISLGGYVTVDYAARYPERLISLCLMDLAGLHTASPQLSDFQIALQKGQNPLAPTSRQEYSTSLEYIFYHKPFIPWPISSVIAEQTIAASPFYKKMFDDLYTYGVDLVPLLPRLSMPVLVLWGDHDRIFHVSTTEVLKRSLLHAEIVILENCGHVPVMERPRETALHLSRFLESHKGEYQAWTGEERRTQTRNKVDLPCDVMGVSHGEEIREKAQVVDLSRQGMYVEADEPLDEGTHMDTTINTLHFGNTFWVKGKVIRSTEKGMAIRFTEKPPKEIERILNAKQG